MDTFETILKGIMLLIVISLGAYLVHVLILRNHVC
jgi:hypothetical protein